MRTHLDDARATTTAAKDRRVIGRRTFDPRRTYDTRVSDEVARCSATRNPLAVVGASPLRLDQSPLFSRPLLPVSRVRYSAVPLRPRDAEKSFRLPPGFFSIFFSRDYHEFIEDATLFCVTRPSLLCVPFPLRSTFARTLRADFLSDLSLFCSVCYLHTIWNRFNERSKRREKMEIERNAVRID